MVTKQDNYDPRQWGARVTEPLAQIKSIDEEVKTIEGKKEILEKKRQRLKKKKHDINLFVIDYLTHQDAKGRILAYTFIAKGLAERLPREPYRAYIDSLISLRTEEGAYDAAALEARRMRDDELNLVKMIKERIRNMSGNAHEECDPPLNKEDRQKNLRRLRQMATEAEQAASRYGKQISYLERTMADTEFQERRMQSQICQQLRYPGSK